jgi:hypothetical protein
MPQPMSQKVSPITRLQRNAVQDPLLPLFPELPNPYDYRFEIPVPPCFNCSTGVKKNEQMMAEFIQVPFAEVLKKLEPSFDPKVLEMAPSNSTLHFAKVCNVQQNHRTYVCLFFFQALFVMVKIDVYAQELLSAGGYHHFD